MEIPTTRELELEILVRQRDQQLSELKSEVVILRNLVSTNPQPSETEQLTLPPQWIVYLTSLIRAAQSKTSGSSSSSLTAALTQRVKSLQNENEELYQVLKEGETAKLKEESQYLRRTVKRLEAALKDSHSIVESLSSELASYETALSENKRFRRAVKKEAVSPSRHISRNSESRSRSRSRLAHSQPANYNTNDTSLPTAPRAYKKPRLSTADATPPRAQDRRIQSPPRSRLNSQPPSRREPSSPRRDNRNHHPSGNSQYTHRESAMDRDDWDRRRYTSPSIPRDPERDRIVDHERNREPPPDKVRGREREFEREREREYDRDRGDRRNGITKRVLRRGSRRTVIDGPGPNNGDRGLVERMGL